MNPESCKIGSLSTQENVFSIDNNLDSASLKAVTINDLIQFVSCITDGFYYSCNTIPADPITIQADWKGIGQKITTISKYISKNGDHIMKSSGSSTERDARATGLINGEDIGTFEGARLTEYKSSNTDMMK